jgi:ribonuclease HI
MTYYVVIKGLKTGIFTNWEECKKSINNFSNAIYKKFKNENDAINYFNNYNKNIIRVYTDGSFIKYKNKDYAGYGIYFIDKIFNKYKLSKKLNLKEKTNNRAELYAIIKTIKIVYNYYIENNLFFNKQNKYELQIYTDSEYCIKIFTYLAKEYILKNNIDKPNYDLLLIINDLLNNLNNINIKITFFKVKAHDINIYNNIVDELASKGSIKDIIYNNPDLTMNYKLTFGKYKNKKLIDIFNENKNYLLWLLNNMNINKNLLLYYLIKKLL